jgi:hypothetical protein
MPVESIGGSSVARRDLRKTWDKSRMRISVAAFACIALAASGCGGGSNGTIRVTDLPAQCVGDSGGLLKALAAAPRPVRVDGEPISQCFSRGDDSVEMQALGTGLVAAAETLGDRARAGSDRAALQLGYLVGAAERGADQSGIAEELIRRLQAETTLPAPAQAAYARGHRAGSTQG